MQIDEIASPYVNPYDLEDSESSRDLSKSVVINDEYIVLKTIGQGSFGKVGQYPTALIALMFSKICRYVLGKNADALYFCRFFGMISRVCLWWAGTSIFKTDYFECEPKNQ